MNLLTRISSSLKVTAKSLTLVTGISIPSIFAITIPSHLVTESSNSSIYAAFNLATCKVKEYVNQKKMILMLLLNLGWEVCKKMVGVARSSAVLGTAFTGMDLDVCPISNSRVHSIA